MGLEQHTSEENDARMFSFGWTNSLMILFPVYFDISGYLMVVLVLLWKKYLGKKNVSLQDDDTYILKRSF